MSEDLDFGNNNIGKLKLKKGTTLKNWRQIEEFLIRKNLFISSVPDGIMVTDIKKAMQEIIEESKKYKLRLEGNENHNHR